ncbi:MAG: HDIG domain-containing protein [Bacteroidales bacterium]|nr:HDIG domain-containing protein [Bacteroidales bacterium]
MAKKGFINTTSTIFKVLLFVIAGAVIIYSLPRESHFRYQFQEGKPWRYGLLTAPYSFSIYKTDAAYQAEKDSVLKSFRPYLQKDPVVLSQMLERLENDYHSYLRATVPSYYLAYLTDQLNLMYQAGIVPAELMSRFEKEQVKAVMMVTDKVGEPRDISALFTAKRAYSALLTNLPDNIDENVLVRNCHIENYLTENCSYDEAASDRVREDLLSGVSQTFGMVQRGERIIDQGEIINHDTYLKLLSFKRHSEERNDRAGSQNVLIGQGCWVCILLILLALFLIRISPEIFRHSHNILFILILIVVMVVLSALVVRNDALLNIYMLPYAIIPVLICTFFDSRTAFFAFVITILLCAPIVPFPFEFLMLQLPVGMATILSLKRLTQRSQLILCIVWTFLVYSLTYTGLALLQEGGLVVQWKMYVYFAVNALLMLSAYLLIYVCEGLFGYTSDVTLMELANINTPLLRQFSENCPGSFQHSLQVSNLASAAATAIGANAQLVRTGALYHDIGKMAQPSFYTENQLDGVNPLVNMPIEEAAKIITDHVPNGLKIAGQHRLPKIIRDFIATHHGSGPARYFYTLYKNEHPEEEVPRSFFYPGPNPFSRETAILMMSDTVEAASRSMKHYDEKSLSDLVDNLIDRQVADGAYKSVPITFLELETVKNVLKEKLQSIYHARIVYPAEKKQD